jgi:hypothetical protein
MKSHKPFLTLFFLAMIILLSVTVSAARLPTIGGDDDAWGTVLNTYLNVSFNETGELRNDTVTSSQIVAGSITDTDIADSTNLTLGEKITFTLGEIIDNIINGWITITGSLNVTQNIDVVGNATIGGYLNVTGNISGSWFIGNLNWSDVQNAPTFIANNSAGLNLTFLRVGSTDWTNVTITESQIRDLQSYVANGSNVNFLDINGSSATIHGNLNVTGNISGSWFIGNLNWSDVQNAPTFIANNSAGLNLTFLTVGSTDWTNVTITESQIRDLQSYVANGSNVNFLDINGSSATIHGNLNVTGSSYLGDITISADNITTNGIVSKDGNVTFYNSSGREQVRITNIGRVGVGTSTPSTTLEVIGDITSSGTSWTSRTNPADNNWRGVTYGNGLFVAVGDTGSGDMVMTSPDGISWTARTNYAATQAITYNRGLFVAVGTNRIVTSPDGIVWTNRTSPANSNWWDVTYGNGSFVAVARTGTSKVMTSRDGITWTNQSSASQNNWVSITYGDGIFVAVSDVKQADSVGYGVMTSPDGITWTNQTVASLNYGGVTYGNGLFVAVAGSGTGNRVVTSPDGVTWTNRTSPADNVWMDVIYGAGLFVAVAETGSDDRVMTSPDGINWVTRTSAADNTWEDITYGNGLFVAVGDSGTGDRVMTSGKSQYIEVPHDNVFYGGIELRGNLNVTGTSFLGDVTITSDNITTNGLVSKSGNITLYNKTGGETLRVTEDGKLGLGMSSPSEKLNVSGNIGASGNVSAMYIFGNGSQLVSLTESQIDDLVHTVNGTNLNVLDLNSSSATIHGNLNVTGTSYLGDITITSDNITTNGIISKDGNVSFYNTSGSTNVIISHQGRVGVGNTNPIAALHVQGNDIDTPASELSNTLSLYVGSGSGASVGLGYNSSTHSYIQAYGSKPLIINKEGNFLGIGDVSVPFGPMHLVLPDNAIGLYVENSGGTTDKREFSVYGDTQSLAIGAYNDVGTFIRTLIQFNHDGAVTLPSLGSVTDVRHVCATAAGELELKDGACSGSSRRFKENEKSLTYGLDKLMLLEPKFFNYKTHDNVTNDLDYLGSRTKRRIGLMAEDVYEILPEVVVLEDGVIDSIDYSNLIPLAIKAIQEQQGQINALASQQDVSGSMTVQALTDGLSKTGEQISTPPSDRVEDSTKQGAVLEGSKYVAGEAIILAGHKEVQINFETAYDNIPMVSLTPLEFIDGQYKLFGKTKTGFKIVLQNVQALDVAFDWHAFAVRRPLVSVISEERLEDGAQDKPDRKDELELNITELNATESNATLRLAISESNDHLVE